MTDPVVHTGPPPAADSPLPGLAKLAAEHLTAYYVMDERYLRGAAIPGDDYVLWELALVFPPESKLRVRLQLKLDTGEVTT